MMHLHAECGFQQDPDSSLAVLLLSHAVKAWSETKQKQAQHETWQGL